MPADPSQHCCSAVMRQHFSQPWYVQFGSEPYQTELVAGATRGEV